METYKFLFYALFIGFNLLVLSLVYEFEKCKCIIKSGYLEEKYYYMFNKINYLKIISMLLIAISVVNTCIPVTSSLGKVILIGNILAIITIVSLVIQLSILIEFLKKVDKCGKKKCKINSFHNSLKNLIVDSSSGTQFIFVIGVLLGLFYL
mgnify:FL=1|jgi:hypothetical protein